MQQRVSAVFFDFGGTLFSYRQLAGEAFVPLLSEALERLGVDATLKQAGRAFGQASAESFREFNPKPYYLHRDLFRDSYRRFALALGREPESDFIDWMYERQRRAFFDGCKLRPDCIGTLAALRAGGLHVAIVSNIDDDYLLPMLEKVGLESVLDTWTSSEEARSCKPDGAIFDYCMKKADVTAEQSFFVGDSPVHDVAGAARAGMQTVLLCEPGQTAPGAQDGAKVDADYVIEELAELLPIVLPNAS